MKPNNEINSDVISDDDISEGIHLCYIYNDDAEREKAMASFFARGLAKGEKIMCIVDSVSPHDVRKHLKHMGVVVEDADASFSTAENDASYCPQGRFSPDDLLKGVGDFTRTAKAAGFNGTRISGDMSWALRHNIELKDLMEYEIKVLDYLKHCPFTAICEYDARKFDGATIMDVLSVHPAMIIRGQVVKNPFYMAPQELLSRLHDR